MSNLYNSLIQLNKSDMYPFHMPGHKRLSTDEDAELIKQIKKIDITEITGFDDLHSADGLIRNIEKQAALLYGADDAFLLINGSSAGILAALSTVLFDNDKILFARNSHKAAYNALLLNDARPDYIWVDEFENPTICGGINPQKVDGVLSCEHSCLYITSPTYEGIISDVKTLTDIAHAKGVPIIVDAAHGAHFEFASATFADCGIENPIKLGADIAIVSLHKTLNAPTQTGLLLCKGDLIDRERLKYFISLFQSTSPSYILMAGIENCISSLTDRNKIDGQFRKYRQRLDDFLSKCRSLKFLRISTADTFADKNSVAGFDIGKLIISVGDEFKNECELSGRAIFNKLRDDYHLELEYASSDFALAMTSVMDTDEGFVRLYEALSNMDEDLVKRNCTTSKHVENGKIRYEGYPRIERHLSIREAKKYETILLGLKNANGYISADFIYAYPPGIPIVAPGEIISEEVIKTIYKCQDRGIKIRGLYESDMVKVIREDIM